MRTVDMPYDEHHQSPAPFFRGVSEDASEWRDRADRHAMRYRVTTLAVTAQLERGGSTSPIGIERSTQLVPVIECQTCGAILREANKRRHDRLHRKAVYQS
jgi:hypothetical protein